jgi:antitoxin (DNA-binding transcriptional repressor) of toxin-antitoxin stability system
MPVFTLKHAAGRLPQIVERAEAGEEIFLKREGKVVAKVVAVSSKPIGKREFGRLKGLVKVGPKFFEALPEKELKLWEGR